MKNHCNPFPKLYLWPMQLGICPPVPDPLMPTWSTCSINCITSLTGQPQYTIDPNPSALLLAVHVHHISTLRGQSLSHRISTLRRETSFLCALTGFVSLLSPLPPLNYSSPDQLRSRRTSPAVVVLVYHDTRSNVTAKLRTSSVHH